MIAVNFFFQPGHVYSSGATGLRSDFICSEPTLYWLYDSRFLNLMPLISLWLWLGTSLAKFTIFTFYYGFDEFPLYSVCASDYVDQRSDIRMPCLVGLSWEQDWFALRNNISSGGTDSCQFDDSKTDREKNVGSISFLVNGTIMLIAGLTFWLEVCLYLWLPSSYRVE